MLFKFQGGEGFRGFAIPAIHSDVVGAVQKTVQTLYKQIPLYTSKYEFGDTSYTSKYEFGDTRYTSKYKLFTCNSQ